MTVAPVTPFDEDRPQPRCPTCRAVLEARASALRCGACARAFPVVAGIPDLRVAADPFLPVEADHAKALRLSARARDLGFRGLLDHYWELTPEEPRDLVAHYIRHDVLGEARGEATLAALQAASVTVGAGTQVLELGTRTGGFAVAAAATRASVTAIDIALRWLVVARQRLDERGLAADVVCACAEALPFADAAFDVVVAGNLLEHTRDAGAVLRETARVLRPGGTLLAVTCNRFSLGPEPHVRVWGVGFLPRPWMSDYVRWRRGHPYEHVRLLSARELRRAARAAGLTGVSVTPGLLARAEVEALTGVERRLAAGYARVAAWPFARPALVAGGPLLQLVARRPRA